MKWIIVAILFAGDAPVNSKLFAGPAIDADCKAELAALQREAKAKDVDVWAECVEVKRPPVVQPKSDRRKDGDGIPLDERPGGGHRT